MLEKKDGKIIETVTREVDVKAIEKYVDMMKERKQREMDEVNGKYDMEIQRNEDILADINKLT